MIALNEYALIKLLGVMFQGNLKFETHVQYILTVCNQRLYLLKLLRNRGIL